jgi:hypothetical protein
MSKLVTCKTCKKEVSSSTKVCPGCGAKLKMGLMMKGIIAIAIMIVLGAIFGPSKDEKDQQAKDKMQTFFESPIDNISGGELKEIFSYGGKSTDIQRDNKEKELIGKVVKWNVKVYEVKKNSYGYKIQTSGTSDMVGTFANIAPQNEEDKTYIEALQTDDFITIKGKITGISMRHINLKPAMIIR